MEMWDVHGDVGCARRCGMCTEMWGVHGDVGCARRCGMCTEMWDVHGGEGCAQRCGMCTEMWDVHGDVGCARRCGMCTEVRGVHRDVGCARRCGMCMEMWGVRGGEECAQLIGVCTVDWGVHGSVGSTRQLRGCTPGAQEQCSSWAVLEGRQRHREERAAGEKAVSRDNANPAPWDGAARGALPPAPTCSGRKVMRRAMRRVSGTRGQGNEGFLISPRSCPCFPSPPGSKTQEGEVCPGLRHERGNLSSWHPLPGHRCLPCKASQKRGQIQQKKEQNQQKGGKTIQQLMSLPTEPRPGCSQLLTHFLAAACKIGQETVPRMHSPPQQPRWDGAETPAAS
ncbi:uncharacterized protein LOC126048297 isoform X3 [Accipiter gentilis]|uniref:uncharacterized protein LOC126048297 isoform X3 n=2 Tax=Astur gentilis TaxID=8957 RepID=UPI00210FEEE1|nr:uncharacterized protein LOC126048297 isoform X3 [Accipiter gentilis]